MERLGCSAEEVSPLFLKSILSSSTDIPIANPFNPTKDLEMFGSHVSEAQQYLSILHETRCEKDNTIKNESERI